MITFFYYAAGAIFVIGSIMTAYWFIDQSRKKRYERDFNFLFSCVSYYVLNKHNFEKIWDMFQKLRKNDQDVTRTNALWIVFQERYREYVNNDVEPTQN